MKIENGISLAPPSADAKRADQDAHLRDAAKMYENHFLNEMVKAMRSTTGQEEGLVKQNFAEKLFTEQLDQQYVEGWAKKGGVGLADMIYTQIKEQYMGATNKQIAPLHQVLPIAPKTDPHGIGIPANIQMKAIPPAAGAKLSYRFEGEGDVQTPMAGTIEDIQTLGQGWNSVKLDHGQGLKSSLTFPGQSAAMGTGMSVQPGQKLGTLDPSRPVLSWNLEWT